MCKEDSSSAILENSLEVLLAVLEGGLKIIQLLLQIGQVLFQIVGLLRYPYSDVALGACNEPVVGSGCMRFGRVQLGSHFADSFVNVGILGQSIELNGGQLQHTVFAVLCCHL